MTKYKIVLDRLGCIGAASCVAVNPELWELQDDGKVSILGGKKSSDGGWEEIIFETESAELFEKNLEAAKVCPVNVIHIYRLNEKGDVVEKLI